ncbi:MAG: hypothetical protein R6V74_08555 [Lutibacter sp.]
MKQSYDNKLLKNRIKSQTIANTAEQSFKIYWRQTKKAPEKMLFLVII